MRRATKLTSSAAFVAPSANGVRTHQAAGIAATVTTQSTSSTAAGPLGTRLQPAASAPAAAINGAGRSA